MRPDKKNETAFKRASWSQTFTGIWVGWDNEKKFIPKIQKLLKVVLYTPNNDTKTRVKKNRFLFLIELVVMLMRRGFLYGAISQTIGR